LKKSNTDLKTLRDSFVKAGPEGTKTFMALAQSIVAAEVPTKRMNAGLEKMLKTLKDTARWQISSNIMHGLQGALQEAYGYAQDLNKSLNDIRIVTGYSTDQMENFAVSANKAAKALSTTTNEYTKASLIYFQQGLSDQEVTKRTQTTIKMANVTGEAAEDVSSYMTAVWNNFDNGSKKLEYYADAITALGAATASSSEEIATGLQKFSAVANTVGLSYEYATAALATVTS
jgi:TP901 family phage tail tape measure protein